MSLTQDIFEIVFTTRNLSGVVADFQKIQSQAQRLQQIQQNAYYNPSTANLNTLQNASLATQQLAMRTAATEALGRASAAVGILREEIGLIREAVDEYGRYASEVKMLQSITGGTTRQAEAMANLGAIAGVSPNIAIREMGMMARSENSPKGQAALQRLGVKPSDNELETFYKVIEALRKMQNGAEKTRLEMDIMGARGARAAQPFLNMQQDIYEKANALNANLDGPAMQSILHLQQGFGLLGQTMLVDFVIPIAQKIVPAIDWLVTEFADLVAWLHAVDEAFGGIPSWIAVFTGIGVAVGAIVIGFTSMATALKAVIALQIVQDGLLAVMDAFSGNWVALGAGVALAAGVGVTYAMSQNEDSNAKDAGSDVKEGAASFKESVNDFGAAVKEHTKSWSNVAGSQIGANLREADYAFLLKQGVSGAIG